MNATITKMSNTRTRYEFDELTPKGERIIIDISRCEAGSLTALWLKRKLIPAPLPTYWHAETYAETATDCRGYYNPQINYGNHSINFDWLLEATEENKRRLVDEIIRQAYNQ